MYKKVFLSALIGLSCNLFAEISAFGAGDLKASNPYGLSESEKMIYANKKATLANQKEIKLLKYKLSQMEESMEGMRSVVDSLNDKVGQTGAKLHQIDQESSRVSRQELDAINAKLTAQEEYLQKMSKALEKLSVMIDEINSNYVTHKELELRKKKVTSTPKKSSKRVSNAELLKAAISEFRAKKYQSSIEKFKTLVTKGYKPAMSNYYLGENAYYQKHYEDAIVYYRKSAQLYDKASYMPTLLLHTALSFKRVGDKKNADLFFGALIDQYPASAQAKIAKKSMK